MINEVYEAIAKNWQTRGTPKQSKDAILKQLLVIRGTIEKTSPPPPAPTTAAPPGPAPNEITALQKQVNGIQQSIAEIKAAIEKTSNTKTTQWATIVGKPTSTPKAQHITDEALVELQRRNHDASYQVTLSANGEYEATQQTLKTLDHRKILTRKLQATVDEQCPKSNLEPPQIPGISKLPNGSIRILCNSREGARILRTIEWGTAYEGLQLHQPKHRIVIHGIPTSVKNLINRDNELAMQHIKENNPRQIFNEITPLHRKQTTTEHHSFLLTTDSLETLQISRRYGVHINYCLYRAEPYCPQFQLTQCFNCHEYGHRAAECKSKSICGKCGSTSHKTNSCTTTKPKCCNCKENHEAWNNDCSVRTAEKQRLHELRKNYSTLN